MLKIDHPAGSQGEALKLNAIANEVGDVRVPECKVFECKTREPPEGDLVGTAEGHELLPELGELRGSVVPWRRRYSKFDPFGLATADDILEGAADGAEVRGRQVEAEGERLDGMAALAFAAALGRRTYGEQSGREGVHALDQRGSAEAADAEQQDRELVREVAPPRGGCAGADRVTQVEAREDSEEEFVGEIADPVLISGDVELERRRLHGRDWGGD